MAFGDHIKVRRMGGLITHHGIDLGDGGVIHFVEAWVGYEPAEVRRTSLAEFAKGEKVEVVEYPEGKTLSPDATVNLARENLGQRGYHLVFNNCEHFATFCKTGEKRSRQSTWGLVGATALTLGGMAFAVARAIIRSRRI